MRFKKSAHPEKQFNLNITPFSNFDEKIPPKIEKVLIVYKKSSYEEHVLDEKDKNFLKLLREKRKLEPEIEKGITDIATAYIKELTGKRKKESPDQFDEYLEAAPAKAGAH